MIRFIVFILCFLLSTMLCIVVDLQFLEWPFSKENNYFLLVVSMVIGFLGGMPLIGFNNANAKRRTVLSIAIISCGTFLFYLFNLVIFTI